MEDQKKKLVLVARKPCFGLPTACPACLPVYVYLRLANLPFDLHFATSNPDSDDIPLVEYDEYVAYNNERGGVIETLKEDGIVDLDSTLSSYSVPEWLSAKAMVSSWLVDAALYELWVGSDGSAADKIYFSDLPWPLGKLLHFKQSQAVKLRLGITKDNAEEREAEIFKKANLAYEALSLKLGDQKFLFGNRPTSVDAIFLGHALFVLHNLAETSILRTQFMQHENLVKYTENVKKDYMEAGSSSSMPWSHHDPSSSSSSTPRRTPFSQWRSKAKPKPKKEKTEEEKTFRRRAKYFLATQAIAILIFLSLLGGSDDNEVELDDEGLNYDDE